MRAALTGFISPTRKSSTSISSGSFGVWKNRYEYEDGPCGGRISAHLAPPPANEPAKFRFDGGDLAAALELPRERARGAEPGDAVALGGAARCAASRTQCDAARGRIRPGLCRTNPAGSGDGCG